MGLTAIAAAAAGRPAMEALALAPESSPAMREVTRQAGMKGWEGELSRRAEGAALEDAVAMLAWWSPDLVRSALASARARPTYDAFLAEAHAVEAEVAESVLGQFPYLDGLASDLEWLVMHCHPGGRPQLPAAIRRGFPEREAPRAHALAMALHLFHDDCLVRAWSRVGVEPLAALVLDATVNQRVDEPLLFGWGAGPVATAARRLAERCWLDGGGATAEGRQRRRDVQAEADMLSADPWESMTESRRTRALGVVQTAADRVGGLPRA